jgi:3'(2'), 5'-bisphosphate nucleotidase
LNEVE